MPIDRKPKPGTARRAQRKRAKARRDVEYGRANGQDFAAFVRTHPCVGLPYGGCEGPIEAAHLRGRGAHPGVSGVGSLASLCRRHHREGVPRLEKWWAGAVYRQAAKLAADWSRA